MNQRSSNETWSSGNWVWSRTGFGVIATAVLAAIGVYLCYRLAQPCIPSLVWAGALALVFTPLHRRIEAKLRRPNLATVFSLVIIGLLVVAPATWFAQKLAEQATSVPETIQKQIATGKWHIGNAPAVGAASGRVAVNAEPFPDSLRTVKSPPMSRANLRARVGPRLVAQYLWEVDASA